MKNVILKSSQIFTLMAMLNFLLSVVAIYILGLPGESLGMAPFLILLKCVFTLIVAFITVLLFKKNYNSVLRIALLFEIIYLISLVISGFNPFGLKEDNIYSMLIYLNSFIVLFFIFYGSQLVSSKRRS
ncbi:hypothetical protein ASG31_13145 [Chryseobacterium sp. Leaf404]|uniref:hypothetical protein n=1 Tax=unclassified Chryseobacterium TaxID=2593645 RepID=UPI0006FC91EC|nr:MULTISPECIES: hypothetical protein [unclassified Chryseobacterium]KQT16455.1 hypothetical protein ASG31_13145 [Chryseobacterium sp. Leaf404]